VIRSVRLESAPIDPGERVTLTCPLSKGHSAMHLDVDAQTAVDFEIVRAEKSSTGAHVEVRCRARAPSVFRGALLVSSSSAASDLGEWARSLLR
jgi:hypothetical protein